MDSPPRHRMPGETVFVSALLMLSLFLFWTAFKISGFKSLSSAGAYPMAATATMVVCAIIILLDAVRKPAMALLDGETPSKRFARVITPIMVIAFSLAIICYMLALEPFGFVFSSFVFLIVSTRVLGSTNWIANVGASVVTILGIYIIFQTAFSVVLPQGEVLKAWLAGTPYLRWLP